MSQTVEERSVHERPLPSFRDGLGFRYEFPEQKKLTYFVVADELTEFALTGDHTAWWVAGDYDTQEFEYQQTKLSGIRGQMKKAIKANSSSTPAGPTTVADRAANAHRRRPVCQPPRGRLHGLSHHAPHLQRAEQHLP